MQVLFVAASLPPPLIVPVTPFWQKPAPVSLARRSLPVVEPTPVMLPDDPLLAAMGQALVEPKPVSLTRPRSRAECAGGVRPCPWVSCRYHLYLDVRADGVLRVNFPDKEPDELPISCALDVAGDGPRTLDAIAGLMGMSKERARQLEAAGMESMRRAAKPLVENDEDFDLL